jgi:hypothetical protein
LLFKAGSEILPVRSGATELGKEKPATYSSGGGKGFSVPFCFFLCLSKLEVKFSQRVAVRTSSRYLRFLKLNARQKPVTSSRGGNKGFSVPFCFLNLEAKFFQCVAVRTSSGYLKHSKLNEGKE